MAKRSNTPTEESVLAKWIVDHITIEAETRSQKNPTGRAKGGKARAGKVSSNKRRSDSSAGRKSAMVQKRRISVKPELDEQELTLFHELQKYVNKWVAVLAYGTGHETVVASGNTIVEARKEAESKGYHDVTFLKVPPGDRVFVPTLNASGI
jgi:uncharacterized protein DUF5678